MCRNRVKLTLPALLEVVDIIKYGRGQFQFFFYIKMNGVISSLINYVFLGWTVTA